MNDNLVISAGKVDITPQHPVPLGGYARRLGPYEGIADRLEANALIIQSRSSRVIIITADLLYPGETLRRNLLEKLGIVDDSELFLCASHTHFAPMTAPSMPRLGVPDDQYVSFASSRIVQMINELEECAGPVACSYHTGELNHSINRRLICRRLTSSGFKSSAGFGPNPRGARDETVRIFKLTASDGSPVALLWNYACHATDATDLHQVSAAYPGAVRARLRAQFGDIPILFFQGFAGDVRPPFAGLPNGIRGIARRVLRGPQFKDVPDRAEWEQWSNSLAQAVASVAQSPPRMIEMKPPRTVREEVPENAFAVGGDGSKSLFWHVVDCGGFRLAGINAEPVNEYRALIEQQFAGTPFISAGYLDQTHCYLPIDRMIAEGGYEVEGFRDWFNFAGRFRAHLQEPVIEALKHALAQC